MARLPLSGKACKCFCWKFARLYGQALSLGVLGTDLEVEKSAEHFGRHTRAGRPAIYADLSKGYSCELSQTNTSAASVRIRLAAATDGDPAARNGCTFQPDQVWFIRYSTGATSRLRRDRSLTRTGSWRSEHMDNQVSPLMTSVVNPKCNRYSHHRLKC